jgi:hypothetical protein
MHDELADAWHVQMNENYRKQRQAVLHSHRYCDRKDEKISVLSLSLM